MFSTCYKEAQYLNGQWVGIIIVANLTKLRPGYQQQWKQNQGSHKLPGYSPVCLYNWMQFYVHFLHVVNKSVNSIHPAHQYHLKCHCNHWTRRKYLNKMITSNNANKIKFHEGADESNRVNMWMPPEQND